MRETVLYGPSYGMFIDVTDNKVRNKCIIPATKVHRKDAYTRMFVVGLISVLDDQS